jgi:hypothetical protein
MLAPYDATMVCHPDGRIAVEGTKLHEFLTARYWEYDCIPEELILNGDEPLTKYKVLLLPYTLWAREKLQRQLLDWTARGNTLIAIGPFGNWNEYGQESRTVIDAAFGKIPLHPVKREPYFTFTMMEKNVASSEKGRVEYAEKGNCRIASAAHGKGRVYLTDASIETLGADARAIIHQAIAGQLGAQAAYCESGKFFLYTRDDTRSKNRFLIAVNKDIFERNSDTVFVAGDFERPVDQGVRGGFPIGAKQTGGFTTFTLSLAPGETAFINLGPYRASANKPVASARDWELKKIDGKQNITLTVLGKNGKAIPDIKIHVVGKSKRTGTAVFDYDDLPVNAKGQAVFAVPPGDRYDLVVYDKQLNAEYPLADVDPARSTQYRVSFLLFRK